MKNIHFACILVLSLLLLGSYTLVLAQEGDDKTYLPSLPGPQRDVTNTPTATPSATPTTFPAPDADFNGDGYADLAVGVSHENVGDVVDAGALNIFYGAASGVVTLGNLFLSQTTASVPDVAEAEDHFGEALTTGDFNGDGYTDLAAGVHYEDVTTLANAGAVNIFYGAATGITVTNSQLWTQDSANVVGEAAPGDEFGEALSAGDFNGDGYADLAVGIRYADAGSTVDAGAVSILYGAATGITGTNSQLWTPDSANVAGEAATADFFGESVSAGDFNGDGYADLAIGVRYADVDSHVDAGAVNVLYGTATGLTATKSQRWTQDSAGVVGEASAGDRFGESVAAGDFNHDGYMDLAVGVPFKSILNAIYAGEVAILYGSSTGLAGEGSQLLNQNVAGVAGVAESDDQFSHYSLTVGNFNGDAYADLVVGVRNEDHAELIDAGAVASFYGSATGLTATGNQLITQGTAGMLGEAGADEHFGQATTAGDYNGDGYTDLAVGTQRNDVNGVDKAGAVNVLPGSSRGITTTGTYLFNQDTSGVAGANAAGERFGTWLAAWDFNRDSYADLAIGKQIQAGQGAGDEVLAFLYQLASGNFGAVSQAGGGLPTAERFVESLVLGNFNADQYPDVAIGFPDESEGGVAEAGAVDILFGTAAGFDTLDAQTLHQDVGGVAEQRHAGDHFGQTVIAGDFNGDGHSDLAVSVPGEGADALDNSGAVQVFKGGDDTVRIVDNQFFDQEMDGLPTVRASNDLFGAALAVGDFNDDGYSDLAVGAPFDDEHEQANAGTITVFYGSFASLTTLGSQTFAQGVASVPGEHGAGELFGAALTSGDFNGDGYFDLAVGVPQDSHGGRRQQGSVNILYGSAAGITALGSQLFDQDSDGVTGIAQAGDNFGAALTAGDFNADGYFDLAVGVPGDGNADWQARGVVNVLYGSPSGITPQNSQIFDQDTTGVSSIGLAGAALAEVDAPAGGIVTSGNSVSIVSGSPAGIDVLSDALVDRDTESITGAAEAGDHFGHGLR